MTKKPKPPPPPAHPKEAGEHLIGQIESMRPLVKLIGFFKPAVREQFAEVEKQLETVKQMQKDQQAFAETYGPLGWTTFDRLSTEIVAEAVSLHPKLGEPRLTAHHLDPEILQLLGYRFHTPAYAPWLEIFDRAVERAMAEDYLSCVPLVLMTIDGVCTTTTQKHPFSGGADAPVFDTATSKPGGIADGLKILGATRRKLSVEPIAAPYRHGIVHGLDPNFGHAIVAAKAFNLLQATVDYFDRRRDEDNRIARAAEEQKPLNWRELGKSLVDLSTRQKALDAWVARPQRSGEDMATNGAPHSLDAGTPEAAAAHYLDALMARNFGFLAERTIDYPKRSLGYRSGRLRNELTPIQITGWRVTGVRDEGAAVSVVETAIEGLAHGRPWAELQEMRLLFFDEDNQPVTRGGADAQWLTQPDYCTKLWQLGLSEPEED